MGNKTVVVIGAVNMDICGRPDKAPRMKDSNPGTVSFSPGGVGRNIAHNLCLLDIDVKFIAAIGDDVYGDSVYESCVRLGMDMHLSRRMSGGRTSSYLYVTDENGDMLVGVSDTDISASITPEYLKAHIKEINAADAVVIDANLTRETVAWIAENVTAPLYADPVSAAKAERLRPALSKLTAFKPNEFEAKSMTNETTSLFAAEALLREGVKKVFVSLGSDGIVAAGTGGVLAGDHIIAADIAAQAAGGIDLVPAAVDAHDGDHSAVGEGGLGRCAYSGWNHPSGPARNRWPRPLSQTPSGTRRTYSPPRTYNPLCTSRSRHPPKSPRRRPWRRWPE